MRIVQCKKCGKIIHHAPGCYHCGGTDKVLYRSENAVNVNIASEFSMLEGLLKEKKFDDILRLTDKIIEWMPTSASIYWVRLLAKHACSTDIELICTGVNLNEDPEYLNALMFADMDEKKVFADVSAKILAISKSLATDLRKITKEKKQATGVRYIQQEMQEQIPYRKQRLIKLWLMITSIEQEMIALEKDCQLITHEYYSMVTESRKYAMASKDRIYRITECTEQEFVEQQIDLDARLQSAMQARDEIQEIKQNHPWVIKFKELQQKRDRYVTELNKEIMGLKEYEEKIKSVIVSYNKIEAEFLRISKAIQNAEFPKVRAALGETAFLDALRNAGINY